MEKDLISVRALRGFHEIVMAGSVTEAASRMGMSQSALSRQLAELERSLGFELFHRDHGRLVPTQDALLLFDEVGISLDGIRRLQGVVQDIAEFRVGSLKLVAPPSMTEGLLADIVADFLTRFPKVRLNIHSRATDSAISLVATRTVDGGFLRLPLDRPDLRCESLFESDTVAVLRADHPLAKHDTLTPRLLRGEPMILLGYGFATRSAIENAFAREGMRINARLETHTVGSACALALRGLGVALVNRMLAQSYIGPEMAVRKFEPLLNNEYGFVTSALVAPSRLTQEFLQVTRDHFKKLKD
jgi:DNA-binding transcriptional LysR family regulator